jgi:hypothetical protein
MGKKHYEKELSTLQKIHAGKVSMPKAAAIISIIKAPRMPEAILTQ